MKRISYFVMLKNKKLIESRRWYVDEINMLRELFSDVRVSTSINEIPKNCSVYISWWAQTSLFSVIKAKTARKKSIVIAGGSEVSRKVESGGYSSRNVIKRMLIQFSLRMADRIVAVSKYNKIEILDILNGKYEKKIDVLYHCVADDYFKLELKTEFKTDKYLLMICGFSQSNFKRKCVYEMIEAVLRIKKVVPEIKLVIAGTCEDVVLKEHIQKYIYENNAEKNIIIKNDVSESEKLQLLNNAYYYVQPTYHEQFGVAIAEAMACGCPVISTAVAAVPEVVADTGILLSDNNVEEIEKVILEVYENEKLRNELAVRARERAYDNFSYAVKKNKLRLILEKCDLYVLNNI